MLEYIKNEIDGFHKRLGECKLENEREENDFIAAAEEVLSKCEPVAQTDEERHELAKFCNFLGCWLMVFTYRLKEGRRYYQKALALHPESFDIHWEYFTTLEEIVEDKEQCTPEFIQDAIDCLRFCIDYCDTPELKRENHIEYRWAELGRVYMTAKDYRSARECFERSLAITPDYIVGGLLKKAKRLENPVLRFFDRLFSVFRRKK